ncbi:MAG: ATPase domain-containing protein [Halobacteriales archaeon]|nr:ATPase domain-containing protein [Halobacteriales archaeon]
MAEDPVLQKLPSGTPGLDTILEGGVPASHTTVVTGGPGTGKTILALQFLAAAEGPSLYIGFEERETQLRGNAGGLDIDLEGVEVLDLSAEGDRFFTEEGYSLFPSDAVEGEELLSEIAAAISAGELDRLVIDPLSELRSMLPDDFQFRRHISSLFNELSERGITTLCTAQPADVAAEADLQFLGNTTVEVSRTTAGRTIEVTKYRGSSMADGRHTYRIIGGRGAVVYPKLVPGDHFREPSRDQLASGVAGLDELLHGGLERSSVTVISGPSGVGKTTTASQFLRAAADAGDRAVAFLFEELEEDYRYRTRQLGLELDPHIEAGRLELNAIESLTQSPDEFAHDVRMAVEERDARFVMLDGVAGYRLGLRGDDSSAALTRELHALSRYLKRMGVMVILIEEIGHVTGDFVATDQQISYIADNIVFLRYLEIDGEIQKAIGVLKKRFSGFEHALRSLQIDEDGLRVGEPLSGYRGLLTGTPEPVDGPD